MLQEPTLLLRKDKDLEVLFNLIKDLIVAEDSLLQLKTQPELMLPTTHELI